MDEIDVEDERSILSEAPPSRHPAHPRPDHHTRRLEAKAAARQHHEDDARTATALRAAAGETPLWQHLSRLTGTRVTVHSGTVRIDGHLTGSYADFITMDCDGGWSHAIRLGAGVTIATAPDATPVQPIAGGLARSYRLQLAALELERRREPVQILLTGGASVTGTIDRVGRDYLQLAEHALSEARRPGAVVARHFLPLTAITMLRFHALAR